MHRPASDTQPAALTGDIARNLEGLITFQPTWAQTDPRKRSKYLKKMERHIARQSQSLAREIGQITHRPAFEVMSQEILPVLEMSRYCRRNMPAWIAPQHKRFRRPGFWRSRETLLFEPLGTVAVIMPSNFPFSLGLMSAFYLVSAGNTVVLKPSEQIPEFGILLKKVLNDALDKPIMQIVEGGSKTVESIIESGIIQKIFFFGSKEAGEAIRHKCHEHDLPCVLETGGSTVALIDSKAALERAAAGIAWSAFYTRGHSCIGTRFVFVDRSEKKSFLKLLNHESSRFIGEYDVPQTLSAETLEYIGAAIKRGATYHPVASNYESHDASLNQPGILEVKACDLILPYAIYDPILIICEVEDISDAIPFIRQSGHFIGTSIWSNDRPKARTIIRRLSTTMNWINDTSFGLPNLPWGSSNKPSRGSIFSQESLGEVGRWRWVIESSQSLRRFWWPPYTRIKYRILSRLARFY